jgi:putative transposase
MIKPDHAQLPVVRQCKLLMISRSGLYYELQGESGATLALMRLIDEAFLMFPYYGSRQMARHLLRQGHAVGRHRVRRLMARMGLTAIYQKPRTSTPNPAHRIYPYLLRNMAIDQPNQVWCTDITYISMRQGFMYLVAVMDWATRRVLSWRVSNSMEADFCIDALEEALARHGRPKIFNSDQGSQFTSPRFTGILEAQGIQISMDGRGRWMDNVFIERLWRSLKYECIYLHAFETGSELRAGLSEWVGHYNGHRPHSKLGGRTPDEIYYAHPPPPPGGPARQAVAADVPLAA